MSDSVISYAHEWVQRLPLSAKHLVCVRCGQETPITALFTQPAERCTPHHERPNSGWKDERG